MAATVVLPWRHASELAFVRDCFYPYHALPPGGSSLDMYAAPVEVTDSSTSQPHSKATAQIRGYELGLRRVAVWRFRSARSVPHAVLATGMLVEAMLYDELAGNQKHGDGLALSESAVSSLYAMAFIKFVNGFADRDVSRAFHRTGLSKQTVSSTSGAVSHDASDDLSGADEVVAIKGSGESSMYAHASTIGMPVQFVDLRHRCVHGSGPVDVWLLRRMCKRALEWLWERWWKGNAVGEAGRWLWEVEMEREQRGESVGSKYLDQGSANDKDTQDVIEDDQMEV